MLKRALIFALYYPHYQLLHGVGEPLVGLERLGETLVMVQLDTFLYDGDGGQRGHCDILPVFKKRLIVT